MPTKLAYLACAGCGHKDPVSPDCVEYWCYKCVYRKPITGKTKQIFEHYCVECHTWVPTPNLVFNAQSAYTCEYCVSAWEALQERNRKEGGLYPSTGSGEIVDSRPVLDNPTGNGESTAGVTGRPRMSSEWKREINRLKQKRHRDRLK